MIECLSISKTLSARSYTTVLPAVAGRSPATRTPTENLNARIVVAPVGCHACCCVPFCAIGPMTAGLSRPLRFTSEGKSPAAPEKFWSNPSGERSITDRCAGDSAWLDWDRPFAFFLTDVFYQVAIRPERVAHRHCLVWVHSELIPRAFE